MNGDVGAFLRARAAHNLHAWQNVHPARLLGRSMLYSACTMALLAPIVVPGWTSVGYSTEPRPEAAVVNFLIIWCFLLILWAATLRSIVLACAAGLPDEAQGRRRARCFSLWVLRFNGMLVLAFSVVMMVKTIVWWTSWQ